MLVVLLLLLLMLVLLLGSGQQFFYLILQITDAMLQSLVVLLRLDQLLLLRHQRRSLAHDDQLTATGDADEFVQFLACLARKNRTVHLENTIAAIETLTVQRPFHPHARRVGL